MNNYRPLFNRTTPFTGLTVILLAACSGSGSSGLGSRSVSTSAIREDQLANARNIILSGDYDFQSLDGDHADFFEITENNMLRFKGREVSDERESYTITVSAINNETGAEEEFTLTLNVQDINDVAPEFNPDNVSPADFDDDNNINLNITENARFSQSFAATPDVAGDTVTYELSGADEALFEVDAQGLVTARPTTQFDAESGKSTYNFTVTARVGDLAQAQEVILIVTDINDSAPVFTAGATEISLDEEDDFSTPAYQATPDVSGQTVTYSLEGTDAAAFVIDSATGVLSLASTTILDASEKSIYSFIILATVTADGETQTAERAVTVTVTDGAPAFGDVETNLTVDENGALAATSFAATPKEAGQTVTYSLRDGDHALFEIDSDGNLTSKTDTMFDHESGKTSYSFTVVATANTDDGDREATRAVTVTVTDINDVAPTITSGAAASALVEGIEIAATEAVYTATGTFDIDAIVWSLGGTDSVLFDIDDRTGAVTFKTDTTPDHEAKASYSFEVVATSGTHEVTQTVTIEVTDLNDSAPVFTAGATSISIDEEDDFSTAAYQATSDTGDDIVSYSLTGTDARAFVIDSATGVLRLATTTNLDASETSTYGFIVLATVTADGETQRAERNVTVTVTEGAPTFGDVESDLTVNENAAFSASFTATPKEAGQTVSYSLRDGDHALFAISDNGLVTSKENTMFDHDSDMKTSYSFTVVATANTDDGDREATRAVSVSVIDINDEDPVFTSAASATVDENSTSFSHRFMATPDVAGDTVTYAITGGTDASAFVLNESTGELTAATGTSFDHESGKTSYEVIVTATVDTGDAAQSATQTFTLTLTDINDEAPVFTSAASASVDENSTSFSHRFIAMPDVAGDTVTYAITGGADASAFVLNESTGDLTAAPSTSFDHESGKTSYEVIVTATAGAQTETQTFTLNVTDLNDTAPVFTSDDSASVDENSTSFSHRFIAMPDVDGATVTYALSGTDASAFVLNESTGELTAATGTSFDHESGKTSYEVIVTATAGAQTTRQTFTLNVTDLNDTAPVFTSAASARVDENSTSFSHRFVAMPDVAGDAVTYALSGTDASAFVFNESTGELTAASATRFDADSQSRYEVIVTATAGSQTETQTFTLNVTDLNDSAPVFTAGNTSITIDEDDDFSTPAYQATPDKAGDRVSYSLDEDDDDARAFVIDSATGVLRLATTIDASEKSTYSFTVLARVTADGATQTAKRAVTVTVTDGAPAFGAVETNLTVDENGALAATSFAATPKEAGQTVSYSLRDGDHALFAISDKGLVTSKTNTMFDHESGTTSYSFTVVATANTDDGDREATRAVSVTVTDINDVRPTITADPAALTIAEDADAITGTLVTFTADTDDAASSTRFAFADGGANNDLFNLTDEGALSFKDAPNITQDTTYNVQVMATSTDGENELVSAPFTYTVMVTNLNPALSLDYDSGFSSEGHYPDAELLSTLSETGLGLYSITLDDDRFEIREASDTEPKRTLWIKQGAEFDHEAGESVTITLTATKTGVPDLTAIYTLTLTDINDEAPVFLSDGTYSFTEGTTVTTDDSVGLVMAIGDVDEAVTYSIKDNGTADDGDLFRLGLHETLVEDGTRVRAINLHFKDSVTPDYETKDSYSLTIIATSFDDASLTSEQLVTISVTDIIDDIITGDGSANVLYAGKGEDRLIGHGGADRLYGEQGADVLEGGAGADVLYGGRGDDSLYGDAGNDELYGGEGNDILDGGAGDDIIDGGTGGSDAVSYAEESAGVTVNLATGTATDGSGDSDRLRNIDDVIGSDHDDVITGDDTDNDLYGGDGDDTITSGAGGFSGDVIVGGKGDDDITLGTDSQQIIYHYNSTEDLTIDKRFIDGFDTVHNFTIGEDSLLIIDENQEGVTSLETFLTNAGLVVSFTKDSTGYTQMIWRATASQQMIFNFTTPITGTLADEITAAGTSLTLSQATSIITKLFTSTGNDDPSAGDLFVARPEIVDLLLDEADGTENTTTGYLEIDGGAGDDEITGSAGDDLIYGFGGYDLIRGGAGADALYGDTGNDDIYGGAGDDDLYGNEGDDDVHGGAGHDYIYGDVGDDDLYGDDGDDDIYGDEGDDYIQGGAGHDLLYGDAGADEIYGGDGDDDIYGGSGADNLYSDGGADIIMGGTGDDTITLGAGSQQIVYRLETGDDLADIQFTDGFDTIHDFKIGEDGLYIIDLNKDSTLNTVLNNLSLLDIPNFLTFEGDHHTNGYSAVTLDFSFVTAQAGLKINFDEVITGSFANDIYASGGNSNTVTLGNTKSVLNRLFTSPNGTTLDLLEITTDDNPSGIDII